MKIALIDDWKRAWTYASVHWPALGAALSAIGFGLSMAGGAAAWIDKLPRWIVYLAALVIFLASGIGRFFYVRHRNGE